MYIRYATPFGLTSEYAHPAEILFLGFATIFGPAITGPHLLTLWIWMSLRVLETVEAHCGYDFPWSLSRYLSIYGGYAIDTATTLCHLTGFPQEATRLTLQFLESLQIFIFIVVYIRFSEW